MTPQQIDRVLFQAQARPSGTLQLVQFRNGRVAATFPVHEGDQVMLVTDKGQTIRIPVHDIRVTGRNTQGVKLFSTEPDEHIVSTARLGETEAEPEADDGEAGEE